jgi:hypothetical protein
MVVLANPVSNANRGLIIALIAPCRGTENIWYNFSICNEANNASEICSVDHRVGQLSLHPSRGATIVGHA